jgi:glycosyltransferase involved in cell wall biosynthesis
MYLGVYALMVVFWWLLYLSIAALVWVYVAYPMLAGLIAVLRPVRPRRLVGAAEPNPGVSVIVAVHNEEAAIRRKVENCLAFDYPRDRLEILIVSDGSTDGTDAILAESEALGIRAIIPGTRLGKTEAQNRAVRLAREPILFFTDATTIHPADVLRRIVSRFSDPDVGCVSGRAVFRDDQSLTSTGLRLKQRYDMMVRLLQGRADTLFGATGCVYAVRRDLYVPLRADLVSDFVEPLTILAGGHRTVYEPAAVGLVDRRPPDPRLEFARRSRIVLQGFRGIFHVRQLLNPRHHPFRAIALATQRPLKWLTPLYALGVFVASLVLAGHPFVRVLLAAQIAFYCAALVGWILERRGIRRPRAFALSLYFCIISLAALAGIGRLLRADTGQTWETTGR